MGIAQLSDRFVVWWRGGILVRVLKGGSEPEGVATGELKGLSGDHALELVLELKPEDRGSVHIRRDSAGIYRARVTGALATGSFPQRIRNVLGTL